MKEDDMNGGSSSDNSSTATADATGAASPGPMCVSTDDDAAEGPEAEAAGEGGEGGPAPCAEATHLPLVVLQRDGNSCRWVGLPPL